jgi:hypothetical protein
MDNKWPLPLPKRRRPADRRLTIIETRFDTILPTLATKADLAELRAEIKAELADTRRAIEKDLARAKEDLTRWMLGIVISMVAGFGGMIVALFKLH